MLNLSLDQLLPNTNGEALRELSPADFTNYLIAVFYRAGFNVTRLDNNTLKLDDRGIMRGVVSIAFGTNIRVGSDAVDSLRAKVLENMSQVGFHIEGYMITRTDYTDEAIKENRPSMVLLNGNQILKYHDYLVATRPERSPLAPVPPEIIPLAEQVAASVKTGPKVVAITNNRGGIGKSTTAANLAYGLAKRGSSVLAIDLDGQANLTEMLSGYVRDNIPYHIGMYFSRESSLNTLVLPTTFENLKIIPARPDMIPVSVRSEEQQNALLQFALDLRNRDVAHHPITGKTGFEWVIIDTSPDMGFYTQAAIYAANYLISPTMPSVSGNNGIQVLWDTSKRIRKLIGAPEHARYLGFLITMYDNKQATKEGVRNLANFIGGILGTSVLEGKYSIFFESLIPDVPNVVSATRELIAAVQQHKSYSLLDKEGRAGEAYQKFIEEVLTRV